MYAYNRKRVYLSEIDFNQGKLYNSFAVWQHYNTTLGIGQKVMLLHSVMRLFSACVKKDKMADLLSDA